MGLTKGLNYSIEVEIEMEHRVPTFSIIYLFRKGRFSSCMIHLLLLLFFASSICVVSALFVSHLGPDVGWELRLIIMVCGNMFPKMSFMLYSTWGEDCCVFVFASDGFGGG